MAKVDIIIAIYNVADYLEEMLLSVQRQTANDIRVLMIDDGSVDDSAAICNNFAKKDKRFNYFHKQNGGLSDARNFGLEKADSKYLLFLDGDDYIENNLVEVCLNAIERDHSDIVVFPYYQLYCETDKKEAIALPFKGIYSLEKEKAILAYTPNAAWNKFYKTSLFKDNQIKYPLGYRHEDLGTTPKLIAKAKQITYIDEILYNYRINRPGNITSKVDRKIANIIDICQNIVDWYKKENIFLLYKDELDYLCTINLIQSLRKAINYKDTAFVYNFIDQVNDFKKNNFGKNQHKYPINNKGDFVYLHPLLTKLYYFIHN